MRPGPQPTVQAMVFLLWALVVSIGFGSRLLNVDGDLARHIAHGTRIIEQGGVIRADPFSWWKAGEPFTGFEYGSQVLLALAHLAGGLAGVVVLSALVIAATHALVTRLLVQRGADASLAYLAGVATGLVAMVHWIARPHLFTLLFTVLLLGLLLQGRRASRIGALLLFLVWVNVHAGFIIGMILVGVYAAGNVLEGLLDRSRRAEAWGDARWQLVTLALVVPVTFLNAYGPAALTHTVVTLGDRYIIDNTAEFLSPDFHWTGMKVFLWALVGVTAVLALRRRRVSGPTAAMLVVLTAFALVSQRNVANWAVAALPLVFLELDPDWRALRRGRGFRERFHGMSVRGVTWPWVAVPVVLLGALGLARGSVAGVPVIPDGFDPRIFPVRVVAQARADSLRGRLFHEFTWGGYLLYAWPEQKVFIDGGTDFYGGEHMRRHVEVLSLGPGWRDSLRVWDIELVLLERRSHLAPELLRDGRWRLRDCDSTAVLITRSAAADTAPGSPVPGSRVDYCGIEGL